jgi:hypothetical protein
MEGFIRPPPVYAFGANTLYDLFKHGFTGEGMLQTLRFIPSTCPGYCCTNPEGHKNPPPTYSEERDHTRGKLAA